MTIFYRHILLLLCLTICLASCDTDDTVEVDEELQEYFDRFVEEAAARGVSVDFDETPIAASITIIDQRNVAGTCTRHSEDNNTIRISGTFWNSADDLQREFVVFHELGHCALDREHLERQNADRTCFSIMASGTGTCIFDYNTETRNTYLNELFNQ